MSCVRISPAMRLLVTHQLGYLYFQCLNIQFQMMLKDLKLKTYLVLFIIKLFCTDDFTELCLYAGT